MYLLYEAMYGVIGLPCGYSSTSFAVSQSREARGVCFPVIMFYCCDISERKGMPEVRHAIPAGAWFVQCLKTMERAENIRFGTNRALLEMKKAGKCCKPRSRECRGVRRPRGHEEER